MKIPTFEKIKTNDIALPELTTQLKSSTKNPLYTDLRGLSYAAVSSTIQNIRNAFIELEKDPNIPYPFYVITDFDIPHCPFLTIDTIEKLPEYFIQKQIRVKNKELSLLNKSSILAQKISNINIDQLKAKAIPIVKKQRKLFEKSKENTFYEELIELNERR
ncbi:hypothetical protein HBN50_09775 [Halobacteriovorax sp. GB3]|uniref:hypothetical protein n=1 Tax=Halobacteriovorax sp. GB3 TaxID=2719615 RepID=UPI00235F5DD8|nr:hypothetical protein [Halobacteriovorax sp. GB3]MDD0853387.1 hypothetical protein [Halobacteriovorax sp. GB3]